MSLFNRQRTGYQVIDDDDDRPPTTFAEISTDHTLMQSQSEVEPLVHHQDRASLFGGPPLSHEITNEAREDSGSLKPPSAADNRWDHVENLDQFFTRFYEYHQGGGFICICMRFAFSLLQFLFVVSFSTFLLQCVDYRVLFNVKNTTTDGYPIVGKRRFSDAVISNCAGRLHPLVAASLLFAIIFWLFRVVRVGYHLVQFYEIHNFYKNALGIDDGQLSNLTWREVVQRLCLMQPRLHLIINKEKLTSLDVYQRILRFKNYFVAFVNKEVLPPVLNVPLLGPLPYLSNGLKLNLEWLLFWGHWSPWKGPYALKDEYKSHQYIGQLAAEMESTILYMGIVNLIFFPLIFLYQILYSFFSYAELAKRDPGAFGVRRYSNYGRNKIRHFNELDHELRMRLSRSHKAAARYMEQFISPVGEIVAKNVTFIAGAVFAVLFLLSAWDEDVLSVEHVLTTMTVCGVVIVVCRSFIADENFVFWPESLMNMVIAQIHYAPDTWKGRAHTDAVRREFGHLFTLNAQFIIEELLSPIITPFILLYWVRPKAREFVWFFHNFTISVDGLGDVCSFAQMDLARHGDARWNDDFQNDQPLESDLGDFLTENEKVCANDGKTELSLLHFTATNPDWEPPPSSARFINKFKKKMEREIMNLREANVEENMLLDSIHALLPLQFPSVRHQEGAASTSAAENVGARSLIASLHQSRIPAALQYSLPAFGGGAEKNLDTAATEMSINTMFLRQLHEHRGSGHSGAVDRDESALMDQAGQGASGIWGVPAQSTVAPRGRFRFEQSRMQLIRESTQEGSEELPTEAVEQPPDVFYSV